MPLTSVPEPHDPQGQGWPTSSSQGGVGAHIRSLSSLDFHLKGLPARPLWGPEGPFDPELPLQKTRALNV